MERQKKLKPYKNKEQKASFRFLKGFIRMFYRKRKWVGIKNIPDEPAIIVGNHAQLHGPLAVELYFPYKKYTWCIGQMLNKKEAPPYAFEDFWSYKPKRTHWWYKGLARVVSPLLVYVNKNADTIGVYKDIRGITTFKKSVEALKNNAHIVIFPECHTPFNEIVNEFQDKFVDLAKRYYKDTGKEINFVPMYVAPKLKAVCYGKPIKFSAEKSMEEQRKAICEYLKAEITRLAKELPRHRVVPYANIKKKNYPYSKEKQPKN